jgi:probable F420-dependent oxidoreductase
MAGGSFAPGTTCGSSPPRHYRAAPHRPHAVPGWEDHRVRIGLHALGIGPGADPAVIEAVARAADTAGFSTLWSGEHVVMVDRPDSPYPYASDGRIAVPSDADWLDPLVTLAFVAAVTSRIRVATGILLLPQHNPLVVAKQAASLDVVSQGRFVLGIGIGWSREEFAALGVPFAGRAERTREFVEVMRALWREDVSSYHGQHVRFEEVRSYPKPVRDGRVPVILGGNSDGALDRVAGWGDGWYGFNLSRDELPGRMEALESRCRQAGRDPATVDVAVSLRDGHPREAARLAELGVTELVVVESPPDRAADAAGWVDGLYERWSRG